MGLGRRMRLWPSKNDDTGKKKKKAHIWIQLLTQNTGNHDGALMARDTQFGSTKGLYNNG